MPKFDSRKLHRNASRIEGDKRAAGPAIEFVVHRPKGRLDVVLAGLGDVGEALGKLGNDVKPIFDRMAEITKITRRKSSEYDQLPAPEDQKLLPKPDEKQVSSGWRLPS